MKVRVSPEAVEASFAALEVARKAAYMDGLQPVDVVQAIADFHFALAGAYIAGLEYLE